ncbi:MAG TPA: hypothetical protein VHW05_08840 [Phenylobacterium sp.]|nr:hypothetical protein [Phenylobacterium sp.]
MVDLHVTDMKEVGKPPGRSKLATLEMLKRRPGKKNMAEIDRECILTFGRALSKEGGDQQEIPAGIS